MRATLQSEIKQQIQDLLKKARTTANYSPLEASHRLNISETLLLEYESGEKSPPGYLLVQMIEEYQANPEIFYRSLCKIQKKYLRL